MTTMKSTAARMERPLGGDQWLINGGGGAPRVQHAEEAEEDDNGGAERELEAK